MIPRVFVSSTCYDLAEIRVHLRGFVDGLGYRTLVSEHPHFPVDATESTVENCKLQVEREADILVLVVGLSYGTVDTRTLKSITNLEYLTARAKGIPVYAFLDRRLEDALSQHRAGEVPSEISTQVDAKLLDFVERVRKADEQWTFWFASQDDIIETLRAQFAHLMRNGLDWHSRAKNVTQVDLTTLSGRALRLAHEQPPAWEHLLYAQIIEDEVARSRYLREEHREGLALEFGEDVTDAAVWAQHRFRELGRVVASIEPLVNVVAARAFGPAGMPGHVNELVFAGRAVGRIYASALNWSRRVRTANLSDEFQPIQDSLSKMTDALIDAIEAFGPTIKERIEGTLRLPREERRPIELMLTATVPPTAMAEFEAALRASAMHL